MCVFFNHGIHHHFSPPFGSQYLWFTFSIRIVAINFRRGKSVRNLQSWTPSLTFSQFGGEIWVLFLPVYLSYLSVYLRHHWKIRLVAWYLALCFSVSFHTLVSTKKKKNNTFPVSLPVFSQVVGFISGQIIATSHDLGPQKVAFWKGNPRLVKIT